MSVLQRHYIDLLKTASSYYASWEPNRTFKIGDYGDIDSKTGAFLVQGNIYSKFPAVAQLLGDVESTTPNDFENFVSHNGRAVDNYAALHLCVHHLQLPSAAAGGMTR
jgi:hypothetical protein